MASLATGEFSKWQICTTFIYPCYRFNSQAKQAGDKTIKRVDKSGIGNGKLSIWPIWQVKNLANGEFNNWRI